MRRACNKEHVLIKGVPLGTPYMFYTVPVTVRTVTPGSTTTIPVASSCIQVAAKAILKEYKAALESDTISNHEHVPDFMKGVYAKDGTTYEAANDIGLPKKAEPQVTSTEEPTEDADITEKVATSDKKDFKSLVAASGKQIKNYIRNAFKKQKYRNSRH